MKKPIIIGIAGGSASGKSALAERVCCALPGEHIYIATMPVRDAEDERKVRNGNPIFLDGTDGAYRVYGPGGDFLALSRLEQGRLVTIKSFFEV